MRLKGIARIVRWGAVVLLLMPGAFLEAQQQPAVPAQGGSGAKEGERNQPNPSTDEKEEKSALNAQQRLARISHDFLHTIGGDKNPTRANRGSPYVPLDSWIYPALDRLSSMGLVDSGFSGMRPWTRIYCAQMGSGGPRSDRSRHRSI